MAKNTYYRQKSKRVDIRDVRDATYVIQPDIDECITIRSIGTAPTIVQLPEAIPGREYGFIIKTGGIEIVPFAGDRLSGSNGEYMEVDESIDPDIPGSSIRLVCERYGLWKCEKAVGVWGEEELQIIGFTIEPAEAS